MKRLTLITVLALGATPAHACLKGDQGISFIARADRETRATTCHQIPAKGDFAIKVRFNGAVPDREPSRGPLTVDYYGNGVVARVRATHQKGPLRIRVLT